MTGSSQPDNLERLSDAIRLFHAFQRGTSNSAADQDALLASHPDLRDLLEPMLRGQESPGPQEPQKASPELDTTSPRYFGDYEILRELGRGGMGTVFEARETTLERHVALKILRGPDGNFSTSQVERFRREAAAAGRLHHRGIASIFRVGELDDTHFLAMEFVDGEDLATVLGRAKAAAAGQPARLDAHLGLHRTPMPWIEAATTLAAMVGDALAYAHDHGVVHRDVKPHNIVLDRDKNPRLVDFGLAKDLQRDGMTVTGDTSGTPDYMSPEQVRGETVDARTDIYSLGVVLYELLTLTRPFARDSTHATLHAVLADRAAPPRRLNRQLPRDLETVCLTALEPSAQDRYATAADFAEDLRRVLRSEPIAATRPTTTSRTLKLIRRHRALSASIAGGLILTTITSVAFAVHYAHSRDRLASEQQATARQRDRVLDVLAEARSALHDIGQVTAAQFARSEDSMRPRREVLHRIVSFYEQVSADAVTSTVVGTSSGEPPGGDPTMRLEKAVAESQLGNLLDDLGEDAESETRLRRAYGALLEISPTTPRLLRETAAAARRLAVFCVNHERVPEAQDLLDHWVTRLSAALDTETEKTPATAPDRLALAKTLLARAQLLTDAGQDTQRVSADLVRAEELWEALLGATQNEGDPSVLAQVTSLRRATKNQLCTTTAEHALQLARHGKAAEARTRLQASIAHRRDLEASEPDHIDSLRAILNAHRLHGQTHGQLGDSDLALASFQAAAQYAQQIVDKHPGSPLHEQALGSCCYDVGVALARADQIAEAVTQFEAARQTAARGVTRFPDDIPLTVLLGMASSTSASFSLKLKTTSAADAVEQLADANEVLARCRNRNPSSRALALGHGALLSNFAFCLYRADRLGEACDRATEASEVHHALVQSRPSDSGARHQLHTSAWRAADLCLLHGDATRTMAACRNMVAAKPKDPASLHTAARFLVQAGRLVDTPPPLGSSAPNPADAANVEATEWLQRAIDIQPDMLTALHKDSVLSKLASTLTVRD